MTTTLPPLLEPLVPDLVWRRVHHMGQAGIHFLTHMTVVRLGDGGLWLHSPVPLEAELKAEIDALGPVRWIVAPNLGHHFYVGPWLQAYPEAIGVGAPGLREKRPDLRLTRTLSATPEPEWAADFEQVLVRDLAIINETVFFHKASRSLILTDLMSDFRRDIRGLVRWLAMRTVWSAGKLSVPWVLRRGLKRRAGFREDIEKISAWPFERILLTHEGVVSADAKGQWRQALQFLE